MSEANIREYNFAIPGNIDRHIPGLPGTWPAGSRVTVNEDTNQIVSVWPEGANPMIPMPVEPEPEKSGETAPTVPPAVEEVADLQPEEAEGIH